MIQASNVARVFLLEDQISVVNFKSGASRLQSAVLRFHIMSHAVFSLNCSPLMNAKPAAVLDPFSCVPSL